MRDAAAAIIREVGVETGGSNVQFAINPGKWQDGGDRDESARLRSSALASKATGFPIAKSRHGSLSACPSTKFPTTSPKKLRPASSRPLITWS